MKRIVFLLCTAILLSCFCVTASAADYGWQQAYLEILDDTLKAQEPKIDDVIIEYSYFVYDIDKDGIPELIVKTGTCEADYTAVVYGCQNGTSIRIGETHAGHSSFYGDPFGNGLIIHQGHMGYATIRRCIEESGQFSSETLLEEDLNMRLQYEPDAEYTPVSEVVAGAYPLTLVETYNPLPITQYDTVCSCLQGIYPSSDSVVFPEDDPSFYEKVISDNTPVIATGIDRFANSPHAIGFQSLLKKDIAANWMSGNLLIRDMLTADLNGDGKLECILNLSEEGSGDSLRFFLSEEDGTVYVYIQNYAYDTLSINEDGNILFTTEYYQQLYRLIFEKENCFLLML